MNKSKNNPTRIIFAQLLFVITIYLNSNHNLKADNDDIESPVDNTILLVIAIDFTAFLEDGELTNNLKYRDNLARNIELTFKRIFSRKTLNEYKDKTINILGNRTKTIIYDVTNLAMDVAISDVYLTDELAERVRRTDIWLSRQYRENKDFTTDGWLKNQNLNIQNRINLTYPLNILRFLNSGTLTKHENEGQYDTMIFALLTGGDSRSNLINLKFLENNECDYVLKSIGIEKLPTYNSWEVIKLQIGYPTLNHVLTPKYDFAIAYDNFWQCLFTDLVKAKKYQSKSPYRENMHETVYERHTEDSIENFARYIIESLN